MSAQALAALERLHASGALDSLQQQHGGSTDGARPAKRSRRATASAALPPLPEDASAAAGAEGGDEAEEEGRWSEVLKRCSKAVVVIRCARVRAFDACDARFGAPLCACRAVIVSRCCGSAPAPLPTPRSPDPLVSFQPGRACHRLRRR